MSTNDIRYRAATKRHLPCSVPGCDKPRHGVSALCHLHAKRAERTGSPTGRALLIRELAPYLEQSREFLKNNSEHTAVRETIANLDRWFTEAARCVSTVPAKPTSYSHRLIRELARLRRDEAVTGSEVLALVLAVFLLTQADPRRLEPLSREHRFALARLVLNMTTRYATIYEGENGSLKRRTARASTVLLDKFGCSLLEETVSICSRISATIKAREKATRERRERLAAALQEPFIGQGA